MYDLRNRIVVFLEIPLPENIVMSTIAIARLLITCLQTLELHAIKGQPLFYAAQERTVNPFAIDVGMCSFDEVAVRMTGLPNRQWYVAFLPANCFKGKFALNFIFSAWKSGPKTGKRPGLDQTVTDQDR
jgi:hypothetical protein